MAELPSARHQHVPRTPDGDPEHVVAIASQELQLRDYWRMVAKRRRIVLVVFLAVLVLAAFKVSHETPLYTATTTLKIEPQAPGDSLLMLGPAQLLGGGSYDYYQTQFNLLKGNVLAADVITKLDLGSHPAFRPQGDPVERLYAQVSSLPKTAITYLIDVLGPAHTPDPSDQPTGERRFNLGVHPNLIARYLSFLEVTPVPNTRLVRLSFTTPSPSLSQQLATTHAETFIRSSLETRFDLNSEARSFLEQKLSELKANIAKSEEAVNQFLQKHGVVSLAGDENLIADRLMDLNKRLSEARAKRIESETLHHMAQNTEFQYLSQVVGNSLINQLKGRREAMEADLARLSTIFKPDHPRIQELHQQIREARQRMNQELATIARGVEVDYRAARARENALQEEARRQHEAVLNLKELGVEYTLLQGEASVNRAVYEGMLKRLNESTIANHVALSNIQIVEPPETPLGPSLPDKPRMVMLAGAFGLMAGLAMAFLLEYLDATMKTPADVWSALALPTLGVVPTLKSLPRRGFAFGFRSRRALRRRRAPSVEGRSGLSTPDLPSLGHPFSPMAESYRTIRTGLLLSRPERPPQAIVLASAHQGDGKTTSALNLGVTLAQSGRSVVVVDADLRKGDCHRVLHMPNVPGLANLLSSSLTVDEVVQNTAIERLSLISRGTIPPNPTDLLDSQKMKAVLQTLRERFDFILIDTPPAIVVTDAVVLSQMCDGVLLVVRAHRSTTEAGRRVVELLEMVDASILGVLLNGVDLRDPDFADYRSYYKSYYTQMERGPDDHGVSRGAST